MSTKTIDYTPIAAANSFKVHALPEESTGKTACGRQFVGWNVVGRRVNCHGCKLELLKRIVRRRKRS